MTSQPEQPFGGIEYPPVDYPPPGYLGYPLPYPRYPVDPYDPYRLVKPAGTNDKAIGSLVASLLGLLCCGLPSIAGIILGAMAMRETRRTGQDGYAMALVGVLLGCVIAMMWLVFMA
ncbi:MAG TPA: DUF4190 domain-containing protein, partial [Mycobacterium sp.]|nr:DUF4190 domain-containing protein [Mycobacterium sp.]